MLLSDGIWDDGFSGMDEYQQEALDGNACRDGRSVFTDASCPMLPRFIYGGTVFV